MLHLIKLCVGISSVSQLQAHRKTRCVKVTGMEGEFHVHRTRMRPRRGAEIDGKGSLFWVIKGTIRCRQSIIALLPTTDSNGKTCCDIVMEPQLIRTVPLPKRAFQGWLYLPVKDAPADLNPGEVSGNDPVLATKLAELGLI